MGSALDSNTPPKSMIELLGVKSETQGDGKTTDDAKYQEKTA